MYHFKAPSTSIHSGFQLFEMEFYDRPNSFFLSFFHSFLILLFLFFLQFSDGCEVYLPVLVPVFWGHVHYRNTDRYVCTRHNVNKAHLSVMRSFGFFYG